MAKAPKPGDPPVQDSEKTAKDPDLVVLGRRLAALREQARMTQESLADAAGLHWTYVGQVERGERNLSYKNLLKLARGLGVDPAELVSSKTAD
jgi:transcriptional regulator with XRE-family HTH domain